MNSFTTQRRAGISLLAAAAAAITLLSLTFPGLLPWMPDTAAAADAATSECVVTHFALDPNDPTQANPNKETPGAVGPAVTQRDEAGIKAELRERRSCGTDGKFDPTLTASHYADWSAAGLTSRSVSYASIDAFAAEMVANPDLYASALNELESLENGSSFSITSIPAGIRSVYMVPDGTGGVITKQGSTQGVGTAATFTHSSGAVISYRLECGFQIVHPEPFEGLEDCTTVCAPPPAVPPTTPPPTTPPGTPMCPSKPELPLNDPNCLTPKDEADDVVPPQGVTQRPVGEKTTGQESERQQAAGEVSGNVIDRHADAGGALADTGDGAGTGVAVGGATAGGDDYRNDEIAVDSGATSQTQGTPTGGATSIGGPPAD